MLLVRRESIKQALKNARNRGRWQPLVPTPYQVVASIVQEYRLTTAFAQELAALALPALVSRSLTAGRCQIWWFPLLPPEQYQLAVLLSTTYANPWLSRSRNPWEIRLSREISHRWPDLGPEVFGSRSLTVVYQELSERDDV